MSRLAFTVSECLVSFPPKWVNATEFDRALRASGNPHRSCDSVRLFVPSGCKVMVDAAVRTLSLVNQLEVCARPVTLEFEDGLDGAMGYLNRIGFFDHVLSGINVLPSRPSFSGANLFSGNNDRLVEIARIAPEAQDKTLRDRLSKAVVRAYRGKADKAALEGAVWLIFSELIDNIYSHSGTNMDGYAALQVYSAGNGAMVAVSDSGKGIMQTLRPALNSQHPTLAKLNDTDLLVEIFRQGISRHGEDRGCGLKGSADKAMKFKAELDVRLPNSRVLLKPGRQGYSVNTAYCFEDLPLLWGTHICFSFNLDGR